MSHRKLAFIGAGNMTRSIVAGLVSAGYPRNAIIASNPSLPKLNGLQAEFGIEVTQSNNEAYHFAEVIVLAVKPQLMADVCANLPTDNNLDKKLFISIAAGVTVARLQTMLGAPYSIIRVMPNTPSLLGAGMSGLYSADSVSETDRTYAAQVMSAVGKILWVKCENDINGVIAAAGSSPAYFFLFLQTMQEECIRMGFLESDARMLVQEAMAGSAKMVIENADLSLAELRAQVTSKGGTTAAAINSFINDDIAGVVSKAMQAAVSRAEEMARLF